MIAATIKAPNCDELTLIVGNSTGSPSTILKVDLRRPACNLSSFVIRMCQVLYILQYVLELTFHNFTGEPAAPAADEDDLVSYHHSCMEIPLLAEKEDWYEGQGDIFIQPQRCVVSPSILATEPRDAISPSAAAPACHQQLPVLDDREGVVLSPLGGE